MTATPFSLGRGVTLLVQDDMGRLLDLEAGRFYALNATATRLLTLTLQHGPVEAVRLVAEEHALPEDRVHSDWAGLMGTLRRKRLVASRQPARRVIPGSLTLWLLLSLAWLSLRLLGWNRSVRLWRPQRRSTSQPWQSGMTPSVQQLDQAVRLAAASHLLNPQCKERALVAWHILRNRWGLPAELVVGVLAFPFQAHAWVECGPLTVTDDETRCALYTPAARFQ